MPQLFVLDTGELSWSDRSPAGMKPHPVYAFLVQTDAKQAVLIDTGNPRRLVGNDTASPWFEAPVRMMPEHDLISQLGKQGFALRDIDLLISTHFDFDHCGNHDLFDHGIISIVHADALASARQNTKRFDPSLWDIPGIDYQEITGDVEIAPGLELLHTPGHAAGHLSVLVETDAGPVILAIDALADSAAVRNDPLPSFYVEDEREWQESRTRLLDLARARNATLIPGHERLDTLRF